MYNPAVAVVYETDLPPAPRSGLGPYREADYLALPDEPRSELLYGTLVVTPAPNSRHQEIVLRLARILLDLADANGARALVSPIDVVLAEHSVVQPDVIFVARERAAIVRDRVEGAPDLVIEVLSPGTARRDLGEKLKLYAESGVAEYWIVDPGARIFEFLENRDGEYVVRLPESGIYRSRAVVGLELDIDAFWQKIPD